MGVAAATGVAARRGTVVTESPAGAVVVVAEVTARGGEKGQGKPGPESAS
jgi:hypothetical protein